MTKPGLLIVLSGPSGVGKDSVLREFLAKEDAGCILSVSATTRSRRPGEVEGKDYFFLSREKFGELVVRGEMLEYAQYGDNFYGTPRNTVDMQLEKGKNVILEIEVQGAMQIKRLRPDAVFIFIMPPSWDCLEKRLKKRGTESEDSLKKRIAAAGTEILGAKDYDYIIINDTVENCSCDLAAVIRAAGFSAKNMSDFIEEVASHA